MKNKADVSHTSQGFLHKLGGPSKTRRDKRYCVVRDGALLYAHTIARLLSGEDTHKMPFSLLPRYYRKQEDTSPVRLGIRCAPCDRCSCVYSSNDTILWSLFVWYQPLPIFYRQRVGESISSVSEERLPGRSSCVRTHVRIGQRTSKYIGFKSRFGGWWSHW